MTHTLYHRILRVALLVGAFVLVFDSGFVLPITKTLSENTYLYLANSAGVYAQIEPNELNVITAELTARETELDRREASLRDIETRSFGTPTQTDYSTYILSVILFILTALIITNYVLDWRRARTRIA
jgi:hypothetical protein